MIALDTNVLLRLLLNDEPKQARQAQLVVEPRKSHMQSPRLHTESA